MMKPYKVEQVKQKFGIRWAVVFRGQFRFIRKSKEEAEGIAEKLNNIYERRTSVA